MITANLEKDFGGKPFRFTPTLGNYECMAAAKFYLDRTQQETSEAMQYGTDMHNMVEEFIRSGGPLLYTDLVDVIKSLNISKENVELDITVIDGDFVAGGRCDAITDDGWVVDWKFPGRAWDAEKFKKAQDPQGYLYQYLYLHYFGKEPKGTRFIVVPRDGLGVQDWRMPYDADGLKIKVMEFRARYKRLLANHELGIWLPAPARSRCRWCHFNRICADASL